MKCHFKHSGLRSTFKTFISKISALSEPCYITPWEKTLLLEEPPYFSKQSKLYVHSINCASRKKDYENILSPIKTVEHV